MNNFIKIFSDGASRGNPGPAASAFVVYGQKGEQLFSSSFFLGTSTNNIAEYKGVLMAHKWLQENINNLKTKSVYFYLDSELVVNQLNGLYKVKSKTLLPFVLEIKKIKQSLGVPVYYIHIERSRNKTADNLVNLVLDEEV